MSCISFRMYKESRFLSVKLPEALKKVRICLFQLTIRKSDDKIHPN